jgi:heat shock protein HslJ
MPHNNRRLLTFALLLAVGLFTVAPPVSAQRGRDRSWLDSPLENWNTRVFNPPAAPRRQGAFGIGNRCRELSRPPAELADRTLVRLGWTPFMSLQTFGSTQLVTAASDVDGQCRPMQYHAFVFVQGRYAGTLTPEPMDSRTDGSLRDVRLVSATSIVGEFARYRRNDPMCCPSQISTVTYEIRRDGVVPTNVSTNAAPRPSDDGGRPDSPFPPSSGSEADLYGKRWNLVELRGNRLAPSEAYIEFDEQRKSVAGHTGCNRMFGSFEVTGNRLTLSRVGSTRMACVRPELSSMEADFTQALGEVIRFEVEGNNILRLYGRGQSLMTFRSERVPSPFPPSGGMEADLYGRRWKLAEIRGDRIASSEPYIEFDSERKALSGHTGCNRMFGSFEITGNRITLSRVGSTRMACLRPDLQTLETDFTQALREVTRFEIQGDILRLFGGGRLLLTFRGE